MLRVLLILVPLALAVYALVDLVQTPDEKVQGLPKLAWVAVVVLVGVVGPLAWLVAGKRGRRLPGLTPRPAGPAAGNRRPLAPDDDPDFLRGLGRSQPPPQPSADDGDDNGPDDPPLAAR
jgi:hypothetical protein